MPLIRLPTVRQTLDKLASELKAKRERATADERVRIDHDIYNLTIAEMAVAHVYDGQSYVRQLAKAMSNEEI